MSCLNLGSLIQRRHQNPPNKPQAPKKGHRDREPSNVDRQLTPAPKGHTKPRHLNRVTVQRFDGITTMPTPAGPGETPTPLPPRPAPAPAPGGIPNVGNDVPDTLPYPTAASPAEAGTVDEDGNTVASGRSSWCCCCPGRTAPEDQAVIV